MNTLFASPVYVSAMLGLIFTSGTVIAFFAGRIYERNARRRHAGVVTHIAVTPPRSMVKFAPPALTFRPVRPQLSRAQLPNLRA